LRAFEGISSPIFQEKERVNLVPSDSDILTVRHILAVRQVSEMLHVAPNTVYKLIREGKIPSFRVGNEWRFRRDQIVHWMAEQTINVL
jgi:excisionase family DNA binding protein